MAGGLRKEAGERKKTLNSEPRTLNFEFWSQQTGSLRYSRVCAPGDFRGEVHRKVPRGYCAGAAGRGRPAPSGVTSCEFPRA